MWNRYIHGHGKLLQPTTTLSVSRCRKADMAATTKETISLNPIFSERSDLFSLGCTMYQLFNRRYAYEDYERDWVPSMSITALREYGGTLCPLVTSLMRISPAQRPGTQQLVAALEAYCASRWEKQKAAMLWESLAVVSQGNSVMLAGQAPSTGAAPPPWEQYQERKPFQLPPAIQAFQQQRQQQQQQQPPPMMPAAL